MLVLSRKKGESIHIGEGITLQVVEIKGNRVRIGIEAPDDVIIVRGELPPRDAAPTEQGTETKESSAA